MKDNLKDCQGEGAIPCAICGFEKGHYVCSQAPAIKLIAELESENEKLRVGLNSATLHLECIKSSPKQKWYSADEVLLKDCQEILASLRRDQRSKT